MARPTGALQVGSLRWSVERLKVGEYLYIHNDKPNNTASRIHTLYNNHKEKSLNKHGLETEMVLVTPLLITGSVTTTEKIIRIRRVFEDPFN